MNTPLKIKSVEKPSVILTLGNNAYYYNFDIQPCKITLNELENNVIVNVIVDGWEYIPVYIVGIPNYKDCVKHTIRVYLSLEEEFDLINSYNKSTMINSRSSSKDTDKYINYLNLVDKIKTQATLDFKK